MKKLSFHHMFSAALAAAALLTALSGCGAKTAPAEPEKPTVTVQPAETLKPAESAAPAETASPAPAVQRQDGERFEAVIILEGMEETVHYEHLRSEALGLEIDYDYELFQRRSEDGSERFISIYDDMAQPENYLELTHSAQDAETAAAAIAETLSKDYEINPTPFELDSAGEIIRIDASAEPGGQTMPDQLQMVYVIPAADGCRIAVAHYAIEGAEGFGRRFAYMMNTLSVLD